MAPAQRTPARHRQTTQFGTIGEWNRAILVHQTDQALVPMIHFKYQTRHAAGYSTEWRPHNVMIKQ